MQLQPYIMLNGNAREALNFYKEALDAEITSIQTYGEATEEYKNSEYANRVMHANLKWGDFELMIADASSGHTMTFGDAVNISISLDSVEKGEKVFNALSVGGKVDMPFEKQFWGATFGSFTDKFGVSWMVNAEKK